MVHIRTGKNGFPILNERDDKYNKRAYKMMTPEQVVMSNQREYKLMREELNSFLESLRTFEEESRRILIRAKSSA